MNQNRFLEKHTTIHLVERENKQEEIIEDHKEELKLTETGQQKKQELLNLFPKEHFVIFSPYYLPAIVSGLITIPFLCVFIFSHFFRDREILVIWLTILSAISVTLLYERCVEFFIKRKLPKTDDRNTASLIARFVTQNPEFMQALHQVDSWTPKRCDYFLKIYQEQEESAA